FSGATTSNTSVTKDSRYTDEITAQFNLGNIVDVKSKDGITTSYIYDYLNSLPIAQVTGAVDTAIAYTSFEANGSGGWTIGSTNRITTDSLTGHKSYQLSYGTITKSGLSTSTQYSLCYWIKNSTPLTITGTQGSA